MSSNYIGPGGWTQALALKLVRKVEEIAPKFGCHVALTGGCLYKDGERKDCDLLFYRIRQSATIDTDGLFEALQEVGIVRTKGGGWVHKAFWNRPDRQEGDYFKYAIDLFFPEEALQAEHHRHAPRREYA